MPMRSRFRIGLLAACAGLVLSPLAEAQVRAAGARSFRPMGPCSTARPPGSAHDASRRSGDKADATAKTAKPKDDDASSGGVTKGPGSEGDFDWELWWYHNLDRYLSFAKSQDESVGPRSFADTRREIAAVLRDAIQDPDSRVVESAIVALGKVAGEDDLPVFDGLISEPPHGNQVATVLALGHTKLAAAGERLKKMLAAPDAHPEIRANAALALGLVGDPAALPALVAAAQAGSVASDVLVASYLSIGLLGGETALSFLSGRLADSSALPLARSYAALALGKTGDPAAGKSLLEALSTETDKDVRSSIVIALGALGLASRREGAPALGPVRDHACLTLARVLDGDKDFVTRCLSTFSLGQLNGSGARSALQRAAKGGDPDLRCSALLALGLTGESSAIVALRPFLKDSSNGGAIGAAAAIGLALVGDPREAVAVLAAFKAEERSEPRGYLALALGLLRSRDAVPSLAYFAKSSANPPLARASLLALAMLGSEESLELIRSRATDSSDQGLAVEAIRTLGEAARPSDVPLLVSVLRREGTSWNERMSAVQALGRIGETGRAAPLSRVYEGNNFLLDVRLLVNAFAHL